MASASSGPVGPGVLRPPALGEQLADPGLGGVEDLGAGDHAAVHPGVRREALVDLDGGADDVGGDPVVRSMSSPANRRSRVRSQWAWSRYQGRRCSSAQASSASEASSRSWCGSSSAARKCWACASSRARLRPAAGFVVSTASPRKYRPRAGGRPERRTLEPVGVREVAADEGVGDRLEPLGVGPRRQVRDHPAGAVLPGVRAQGGELGGGAGVGDDHRVGAGVVAHHQGDVAGAGLEGGEEPVVAGVPGTRPVDPADVGEPARPALDRPAQLVAEVAGPPGGDHHDVGGSLSPVHDQAGRDAVGDGDPVDVPGQPGQPGFAARARPQRRLDDRAAAGHRLHLRQAGRVHRPGAGGDQGLEHVGHLGPQRADHLRAPAVRVLELHHAGAPPLPRRVRAGVRAGVAVDQGDVVAAAGQGDGGVDADGSAAGDECGEGHAADARDCSPSSASAKVCRPDVQIGPQATRRLVHELRLSLQAGGPRDATRVVAVRALPRAGSTTRPSGRPRRLVA